MSRRLGILFAIIIAGLLLVGINNFFTDYSNKYNARTCTNQAIAYTSGSLDDPNLDIGTNLTTVAGVAGEKSVCVNDFSTVMSDTITKQPVNEVVNHGTKVPPPVIYYSAPAPVPYYGGSTCNDGTHSNSTGRGTCSWHGGVAY